MQVDPDKIENWQQSPIDGVFFHVLRQTDMAHEVYVVKIAEGVALPAHSHPGWEKIKVLQGTLMINRKQIGAGHKLKIPKDKVHVIAAVEDAIYMAHAEKDGTTIA